MTTIRRLSALVISLIVAATAASLLTPSAVQVEPQHPPRWTSHRAEWIAYESTDARVRLVHPDGSGDHALDNVTDGAEDNPDWSPDGRRLTFVGSGTDTGSAPGLWVADADGRHVRRVVSCTGSCQYLDDPAWSPDGRSIIYSRQAPNASHGGTLELVHVASGRARTVLTAQPGDFYAGVRWSPDGRSVVFEWVHASPSDYDAVTEVTLARAEVAKGNSSIVALTEPGVFPQTADWAPSGAFISYAALATPDAQATDIFIVRPDGSGLVRLTQLAGDGGVHTDVTNDSTGVYFVELTATQPELRRVDVTTHAVSPVGDPVIVGFHPRSRPSR